MPNKSETGKRELIDTGNNKRYVRRDNQGQFKESDDQGRSLAQDVKRDHNISITQTTSAGKKPGS